MKKEIPNLLTLGNLLAGCLAIWRIAEGHLDEALYFVGIGLVFDFADGATARALGVSSPLGKELDSLADLFTFGVVPGFLVFSWLDPKVEWMAHVAWLIPLFSAYRLARFNLDERQTEHFIGLPTPANAAFWLALPWLSIEVSPFIIMGLSILMSVLLILNIPLFSLKFKALTWKKNELRILFLVLTLALLGVFRVEGLPLVIGSYVLLSVAFHRE
ncbi:MAG: CDP-diacylglycerol--serine O-phosphatidyltransferase [Bacteroidota bacterium]